MRPGALDEWRRADGAEGPDGVDAAGEEALALLKGLGRCDGSLVLVLIVGSV